MLSNITKTLWRPVVLYCHYPSIGQSVWAVLSLRNPEILRNIWFSYKLDPNAESDRKHLTSWLLSTRMGVIWCTMMVFFRLKIWRFRLLNTMWWTYCRTRALVCVFVTSDCFTHSLSQVFFLTSSLCCHEWFRKDYIRTHYYKNWYKLHCFSHWAQVFNK